MQKEKLLNKITIALSIVTICGLLFCVVSASGSNSSGFSSVQWTPKILMPVTNSPYYHGLIQSVQSSTGTSNIGTQSGIQNSGTTATTGLTTQDLYHVGILPLTSPWLTPGMSSIKLPM